MKQICANDICHNPVDFSVQYKTPSIPCMEKKPYPPGAGGHYGAV